MSYLYLPGRDGDNAQTADSAATSPTDAVSAVVKMSHPTWFGRTSSDETIISKWLDTGNQRSWRFMLGSSGDVRFRFSSDGSADSAFATSNVLPFAPGNIGWVGFDWVGNNGSGNSQLRYWVSGDGITWTQLGSTLTSAITSLFDSTAALGMGLNVIGNTNTVLPGNVYRAKVYGTAGFTTAGPSGTLVWDANFEKQAPGTTTFTEDSANAATVTVTGSSPGPAAAIVGRVRTSGLFLPGRSGNYASTPNTAPLQIAGDLTLAARLNVPGWRNNAAGSTTGCIVGRYNASYMLSLESNGTLRLFWIQADATTLHRSSTVSVPVVSSNLSVAATLDVNNGAGGHDVKFWTSPDGITWTQLGSTVTNAGVTNIRTTGADDLTVGIRHGGTASILGGQTATVTRAQVFNGCGFTTAGPTGTRVFDADFSKQLRGTTSFAEDANGATVTVNSSVSEPRAMIVGRIG